MEISINGCRVQIWTGPDDRDWSGFLDARSGNVHGAHQAPPTDGVRPLPRGRRELTARNTASGVEPPAGAPVPFCERHLAQNVKKAPIGAFLTFMFRFHAQPGSKRSGDHDPLTRSQTAGYLIGRHFVAVLPPWADRRRNRYSADIWRRRSPSGCTGRFVAPWSSAIASICAFESVTGSRKTIQRTPSVHGGVVSEPS